MNNTTLRSRIEAELAKMNDRQLEAVLSSVKAANRAAHRGATAGELLAEFGGSIPTDELDRMERAIEEGCESIDPD